MSLKIWLPLNGNIVNQGVSLAKFTSVGSSWSYGAGKVTSKCMTCPTTSSATDYLYTSTTFKYKTNFSVSVWVKIPSANQSQNASYIATEGRANAAYANGTDNQTHELYYYKVWDSDGVVIAEFGNKSALKITDYIEE